MTDDHLHKQEVVAATIRSALYEIEGEASRGEISRNVRAFYHNLLAHLGEVESEIDRREEKAR
jgi:hypothetical protein